MGTEEFPLIISPNLGCPKIISAEEFLHGKAVINIILAGEYGEFTHISQEMFKDVFKLVPSDQEDFQEISLEVNDIEEITGWNRLFDFPNPEETQLLISSEVHYNVLGDRTKYWLIKAVPRIDNSGAETFLRKGEKGAYVPTLYDLIFINGPAHKKINYHAVQFVETFKKSLNFIHLTDLHIAQRNDEILGEVLKRERKESRWQLIARKKEYSFIWKEIPGNANDKLIKFLSGNFGIKWGTKPKIEKMENGHVIKIFNDNHSIFLRLDPEKNKVRLTIDDNDIDEYAVKEGRVKIYKRKIRSRECITKNYINFNDNLRRFIHVANQLADRGELDFVIITGDIVDFAGLGWDDAISPAENNWKIFLEIATGQAAERNRIFKLQNKGHEIKFNPGIKVAIFTSTGNHDWRLHPYSLVSYIPGKAGEYQKFGLTAEEAKNYNYKSFDSSEYPADMRRMMKRELAKESLKRLNLDAMDEKWDIKAFENQWLRGLLNPLGIADYLESLTGLDPDERDEMWLIKWLRGLLNPLGITATASIAGAGFLGKILPYPGALIALLAPVGIWFVHRKFKKYADFLVDNPLHAEAKAMHYYFTHINPFFDYALSIGDNYFILMDTGADVITIRAEELMDGKKLEDLKIVSIQDNILGFSPDSMAFDDREAYYNWPQIVWLDKVLSAVSLKVRMAKKGRIFLCLHAPPVNHHPKCNLDKLREGNANRYISEKDCNLTYGTINHYLSQFFFLCYGLRENPHRKINPNQSSNLEKVDLVLSGHNHINMEYRLKIEYDKNADENKVRIYHDRYSEQTLVFDEKKPFLVQTAACGLPGSRDQFPPYWRMIKVDAQNNITSFRHESLER